MSIISYNFKNDQQNDSTRNTNECVAQDCSPYTSSSPTSQNKIKTNIKFKYKIYNLSNPFPKISISQNSSVNAHCPVIALALIIYATRLNLLPRENQSIISTTHAYVTLTTKKTKKKKKKNKKITTKKNKR